MFKGVTDPEVQTALSLLEARVNALSSSRLSLSSRLAILEDDDDPRPVRPEIGSSGSDRSLFRVLSTNGNKLTISGGYVLGFNTSIELATTEVTVIGNAESPSYIYASGVISPSLSGEIVSTAVTTFPVHTANSWVRPLWKVCLINGVASVLSDLRNVIDLKTWAGP